MQELEKTDELNHCSSTFLLHSEDDWMTFQMVIVLVQKRRYVPSWCSNVSYLNADQLMLLDTMYSLARQKGSAFVQSYFDITANNCVWFLLVIFYQGRGDFSPVLLWEIDELKAEGKEPNQSVEISSSVFIKSQLVF